MVITDTMCDVGLNNGANMQLCPRKDMVGKSTPFILDCDVGLSGHQTGTIITNPTLDANDILSFATLLNSSLAMCMISQAFVQRMLAQEWLYFTILFPYLFKFKGNLHINVLVKKLVKKEYIG